MHAAAAARNPFVMLTDPESLLRAIDASAPLKSLHGRICRPLDRQCTPKADDGAQVELDAQVEGEPATVEDDVA
jgi:hypothetical protein